MSTQKKGWPKQDLYLPVTPAQFQAVVADMTAQMNQLMKPDTVDSDYMLRVVQTALASHPHGVFKLKELFQACVKQVNSHAMEHFFDDLKKQKVNNEAVNTQAI